MSLMTYDFRQEAEMGWQTITIFCNLHYYKFNSFVSVVVWASYLIRGKKIHLWVVHYPLAVDADMGAAVVMDMACIIIMETRRCRGVECVGTEWVWVLVAV